MPRSFTTALALAALALAIVTASSASAQSDAAPAAGPVFGVYDPAGTFKDVARLGIEHIYIPLIDPDIDSLRTADSYAQQQHRSLLVTVEPHSWAPDWQMPPDGLRDRLLSGGYDRNIREVCIGIGGLRSDVTIRFAHAMDTTNGRYPWSNWNPADFIAGYRHFVDQCRGLAPRARYMWSPDGADNMASYYPGDQYVDEIGLSVFDLEQADLDFKGKASSLAEDLLPKYDRVTGYNKPIVVAELGFRGKPDFAAAWRKDLQQLGGRFPKLAAVVYFNAIDPYEWPSPYGHPDWRAAPDLFD